MTTKRKYIFPGEVEHMVYGTRLPHRSSTGLIATAFHVKLKSTGRHYRVYVARGRECCMDCVIRINGELHYLADTRIAAYKII